MQGRGPARQVVLDTQARGEAAGLAAGLRTELPESAASRPSEGSCIYSAWKGCTGLA